MTGREKIYKKTLEKIKIFLEKQIKKDDCKRIPKDTQHKK